MDPSGHFGKCNDNMSGYQCKIRQNKVAGLEGQWKAQSAPANTRNCLRNLECDSRGGEEGGGKYGLDFTGYSASEKQILLHLYGTGGPDAQHGVEYILSHGVHILIASPFAWQGFFRRAWFDGNNVYLKNGLDLYNLELWDYGSIIHETLHIEQGSALSHSVEGERLAWQAGLQVYKELLIGA